MELTHYQMEAEKTSIYRHGIHELIWGDASVRPAMDKADLEVVLRVLYGVSKVNGEAGELAEFVGKALRDGYAGDLVSPVGTVRDKLVKELGDLLWEMSQLALEWGITLDEVAEANLAKLASRQDRGVLGGSGDDR